MSMFFWLTNKFKQDFQRDSFKETWNVATSKIDLDEGKLRFLNK